MGIDALSGAEMLSSMPAAFPIDPRVARVGDRYGAPRNHPEGHAGIDIGAPRGTPVRAVLAGTIVRALAEGAPGITDYGNVILVYHPDVDRFAMYAHLEPDFAVSQGQQVQAGEVLAWVGISGNTGGPHLHFEIRRWKDPGHKIPIPCAYHACTDDPSLFFADLGIAIEANGRVTESAPAITLAHVRQRVAESVSSAVRTHGPSVVASVIATLIGGMLLIKFLPKTREALL